MRSVHRALAFNIVLHVQNHCSTKYIGYLFTIHVVWRTSTFSNTQSFVIPVLHSVYRIEGFCPILCLQSLRPNANSFSVFEFIDRHSTVFLKHVQTIPIVYGWFVREGSF